MSQMYLSEANRGWWNVTSKILISTGHSWTREICRN